MHSCKCYRFIYHGIWLHCDPLPARTIFGPIIVISMTAQGKTVLLVHDLYSLSSIAYANAEDLVVAGHA